MLYRSLILLVILVALPGSGDAADPPVDFQQDVLPILGKKCFKCHGPDEMTREADLRLDTFAGATEDLGGYKAIDPGHSSESEVFTRITSDSEDEVMPPADSGLELNDREIETLKQWIQQGAKYEQHWAFVKPIRPKLPHVKKSNWSRNPIDDFILSKLEEHGLAPSPEADRYTLVRRVYLDLVGLPPTIEEADAFVNSTDPQAYGKLVDQLLASPQYGERWARHWLDLARYADTNGYEKDRPRSIWPYRDWVINAINQDRPFDQFSVEQLAGDMLPNATKDQLIATGFHRNTMMNEEGGIDPLEYRFYSMIDRVATTGTVWLGMSIGCAQCHTHKYDPITHTDYYAMMALLNNADEPDLIVPDKEIGKARATKLSEIAKLQSQLAELFPLDGGEGTEEEQRQRHLNQKFDAWLAQQREITSNWQTIQPVEMTTNLPRLELLKDGSILSTGDITKRDVYSLKFDLSKTQAPITALRLEVLPDDRLPARGPGRAFYEGRKGDFFLSEVDASANGNEVEFHEPSHSFGKISIGNGTADAANVLDGDGSTGWATATREGESHQLVLNFKTPLDSKDLLKIEMLFERHFAASLGRFRFSVTTDEGVAKASPLPVELEAELNRSKESLSDKLRGKLLSEFLKTSPDLEEARKPILALQKQLREFPTTMIMRERPADNPRLTHRHHRGEYLKPKEEVQPGLSELFRPADEPQPSNRLEFARWLVSGDNPLAGRVAVNRNWQEIFGRGIVRTTEDFGTQASFPSHPELLDWLATAFISRDATDPHALNWSVKKLHRLIVTSATYRQQSIATAKLLETDPENILLSRGPRFRINAEMIRDLALHGSGLLSQKLGGPSVYPPQPATVFASAYGSPKWPASQGSQRYRRSLYTFSKRTAPFAAYGVFDAPTGENCIVRRDRSNTPLQALTLLNDEMFLEAARAVAKQAAAEDRSEQEIVTLIFRKLLTRPPTAAEQSALIEFYEQQLARFNSNELDSKLIASSEQPAPKLAAWTMVARVLLNLDETVTKP